MEVFDLSTLKGESNPRIRNLEKNILDFYEIKIHNTYNIGIILNNIIENNSYEVYCYIYTNKETVSNLKTKYFKNKFNAILYLNYLKLFINIKGLKFFFNN